MKDESSSSAKRRRTIIAGNWKMHKTSEDGHRLIEALADVAAARRDVEVVVCPPYTALCRARDAAERAGIGLGAQNMFWKAQGAYTGQISAPMLLDLGVRYVILGHSETRGRFGVPEPDFEEEILLHFGETDATVNRKLDAAIQNGLVPMVCVGETIGERRLGETDAIVSRQVRAALGGIQPDDAASIVFAYEPVWAIGTGEVCDADEADRVCGIIRSNVQEVYGLDVSETMRVQYGGSVKPDNAKDLLSRPNIDGALVGGASLKAPDFSAIIEAAPKQ